MGRIVGAAILILGIWIFLFPFTGPAMGLPLAALPMGAAHMAMPMGNVSTIVVTQAMVFSNIIPGIILTLIGVYHVFKERPRLTVA